MSDRYIPEHRRTNFKAKSQFKPDELRRRREERLELRRREVHALPEQVAEQRGVALGVACLRVVEVAHRRVRHEEREERADPLDATERREPRPPRLPDSPPERWESIRG